MTNPVPMVEIWRGDFLECVHVGHAAVFDAKGIVSAWGDPDAVILPRSSCKMIQALPMVESGAADAATLPVDYLALSCASHIGADIHTKRVETWLHNLGLSETDLRCGTHFPDNGETRRALLLADESPCQIHNNCSGKHTGFLTYNKHLHGGSEYIDMDHPVQISVREAFEELTETGDMGHAIDGCSAPNFATTVSGLARAMAYFANAKDAGDLRAKSSVRLIEAMLAYPELIAGEGSSCTELMRACEGRAVVKTGAEGVFVAILPEKGFGVALKIIDGAKRASQSAMAAILVNLGVLAAQHPTAQKFMAPIQRNRRGLDTGILRPAAGFPVS